MMSKSISCDLCPRTYANRNGLFYHKKTHSEFKKYICEQCNKSFGQKGHLKIHYLRHTGEKPHTLQLFKHQFFPPL